MEANDELNKLRLAARALIEWRTPPKNENYQRVLGGLLRCHPAGTLADLRNPVFEIDDDGTLLWYLSETFDEDRMKFSQATSPNPELLGIAYRQLVRSTLFRKSATRELWPGGPRARWAVERIRDALLSPNERLREVGVNSIVALQVPWPQAARESCLRSLGYQSPSLSRQMERTMRRLYTRVKQRTLEWLGKLIFATASLSVPLLHLLSWIILYPLGLLRLFIIFLLPLSAYESLAFLTPFFRVLAAVIALGLGVGISKLILMLMAKLVIGKEVLVARIEEGVVAPLKPFSRFFNTAGGWSTPEALLGNCDIVCESLRSACASIPGVLKSMIQSPEADWGRLALHCSKEATPDVVREVLQLLRLPEIDSQLRAEIFRWLCRVAVVRYDDAVP